MEYIDIHTHTFQQTENAISIINLSLKDWKEHVSENERKLFSVGIHPWEVEHVSEVDLRKLREYVSKPDIKLIGECGLDKNYDSDDLQRYFLKKQIELSEEFKKPLIIHCVGRFNELFDMRKQNKAVQRWIIHGFRGKSPLAMQALKAGCDLSFGEKFNVESVQLTPLEHLFLETDESKVSIRDLYEKIAEIKNCNVHEINAARLLLNS